MNVAFPERLTLLWLLVPVLALLVYGLGRKRRLLARLADERLLLQLAGPPGWRFEVVARVLVFVAISLLLFAFSGPRWCSGERLVKRESFDAAFVLDVSNSMRAQDVRPDRLTRAKRELVEVSRRVGRGRRSLVVFAGSAALQCPLTADQAVFETMLDIASPELVELQGTDLGGALRLAGKTLDSGKGRSSLQVIVMASDGEDHVGAGAAVAAELAVRGTNVFVIGVGGQNPVRVPVRSTVGEEPEPLLDAQGRVVMSRLEGDVLSHIASAGGGEFFLSNEDQQAARALAERLMSFDADTRWVREPLCRVELMPFFVLPALLLLFAAELMTRRRRIS